MNNAQTQYDNRIDEMDRWCKEWAQTLRNFKRRKKYKTKHTPPTVRKPPSIREKREDMKKPKVKQIGQFDGWSGTQRKIFEFAEATNAVSSHSCLLPKFSITFRVKELRKLIAQLRDDDNLTATVAENSAVQLTFVR